MRRVQTLCADFWRSTETPGKRRPASSFKLGCKRHKSPRVVCTELTWYPLSDFTRGILPVFLLVDSCVVLFCVLVSLGRSQPYTRPGAGPFMAYGGGDWCVRLYRFICSRNYEKVRLFKFLYKDNFQKLGYI